jgi:hypothetical protein
MTKSLLMPIGVAIALIAAIPAFQVSNALAITYLCAVAAGIVWGAYGSLPPAVRGCKDPGAAHRAVPAIGVGTVRTITEVRPPAGGCDGIGERLVTIDVEDPGDAPGQKFTGRLRHRAGDPVISTLRPGVLVLVAFDPVAREELSLADDMTAIRAAFDQMLIRKGLATAEHLDLIHRGVKSHGIVTAMQTTGATREDYREVELDVMVRRPEGGQFPAHQTAFIPVSSVPRVTPGCIIDTYYRRGDESAIAVCVSRS